jgi:vesicle coat complex subunit
MLVHLKKSDKIIIILKKMIMKKKSEIVIKKEVRWLELKMKLVLFENVSEIVQGWSYKRLCKINKEPTKNHKKKPPNIPISQNSRH